MSRRRLGSGLIPRSWIRPDPLSFCLSMIFFGKPVSTFPDHALAFVMGYWAGRIAIAAGAAILAGFPDSVARAANGAYAVDAADISEVGSCKVESWLQAATNTDFSAVANPSCAVNIYRPVELSLLTNRSRSGGDWSTSIAPKAKWNIVPTGIGKFGFAFYAGGSFDALTGDNLTAFAVVPATYR